MRNSFHSFLKDERGSMTAEFLIFMPILMWGFIALIVYWDVYRTLNANQKAAYAIADLVSRRDMVPTTYPSGLYNVLTFLLPNTQGLRMRITSFEFDERNPEPDPMAWGDDQYKLLWSEVMGPPPAAPNPPLTRYNAQQLSDMQDQIPVVDHQQGLVLVETFVDYAPRFNIGVLNAVPSLQPRMMSQSVVVPARFRRVCINRIPQTCV